MQQTVAEAAGRGACRVAPPVAGREFHGMLIALLPKLRGYAFLLTRNRAEADDIVQDAVVLALRNRDTFGPGTNFSAWTRSIVRNRFLSVVRQRRRRDDLDREVAEADRTGPPHDDSLALKELARLLGRLPAALREALVLVAVEGRSYEEVAASQGCAVGTAKSRVFRARYLLRLWLLGGSPDASPVKNADARAAAMARAVVP